MSTYSEDGLWLFPTADDATPATLFEVYWWPTCLECGVGVRREWMALHEEWHERVR